jgi:iron complex transport system ATP-binding protein
MSDAILKAEGVCFGYKHDNAVLSGVSLSFKRGEFTGIIGPNGSGKTTLIKLLSGALRPSGGCVTLDGRDVRDFPVRDLAKRISVVPQSTHMDFDMTALDVALMGRQPYLRRFERESDEDIRIARDALTRTDVIQYQDTPVSALSGGEMQRVIIARALTQQTDVMLLDEPVASLDVRHAAHILRLSRDLAHKQQVCGVCVLHDLSLAGWFCDRIALMCAGEVYAYGFPADVLTARAIADVYGVGADIIADGGHVRVLARYESTI